VVELVSGRAIAVADSVAGGGIAVAAEQGWLAHAGTANPATTAVPTGTGGPGSRGPARPDRTRHGTARWRASGANLPSGRCSVGTGAAENFVSLATRTWDKCGRPPTATHAQPDSSGSRKGAFAHNITPVTFFPLSSSGTQGTLTFGFLNIFGTD
jgi:hypothetical protein